MLPAPHASGCHGLGCGVVLVGDSLNMRHPLTGGGMSVALSDVCMLGGKIIAAKQSTKNKTKFKDQSNYYTINTAELPEGIYLLNCGNDNSISTKSIVIQH